jgi:hypothetical protein
VRSNSIETTDGRSKCLKKSRGRPSEEGRIHAKYATQSRAANCERGQQLVERTQAERKSARVSSKAWTCFHQQPIETLKVDHSRGIDDQQTAKIDDPLMQLMERLRIRQ